MSVSIANRKGVINHEEVKSDRKEQSEHRKGRAGSRRFRSGPSPMMPKENFFDYVCESELIKRHLGDGTEPTANKPAEAVNPP